MGVEPVDLAATYGLTEREIDVLAELAAGRSNPEIATRMEVSELAVKSQPCSLYAKTHCRSRVQAVIFAYDSGLVSPGARKRASGA